MEFMCCDYFQISELISVQHFGEKFFSASAAALYLKAELSGEAPGSLHWLSAWSYPNGYKILNNDLSKFKHTYHLFYLQEWSNVETKIYLTLQIPTSTLHPLLSTQKFFNNLILKQRN